MGNTRDQRGDKNPYWRGGKTRYVCELCGKKFEHHNKRRFCSPECWYEFNTRMRTIIECVVCGKEFNTSIYELGRNKGFCCSKTCSGIFFTENYFGENHPLHGIPLAEEHKRKIGEPQMGEKNHQWKGGWTADYKARHDFRYKRWYREVLKRDGKCSFCGRPDDLIAHHIHEFAKYPELRYEPENGMALCRDCHYDIHYVGIELPLSGNEYVHLGA